MINAIELPDWHVHEIRDTEAQRDALVQTVAEALERRYGTLVAADDGIKSDMLAIAETAVVAMMDQLKP